MNKNNSLFAGDKPLTRRNFTLRAGSVAVLPLAHLVASLPSVAIAAKVDETTPEAKALKYASKSSIPEQKCGNCTLYQGGRGKASGNCPLFSGLKVNEAAWCNAWIPRA